MIADDTIILHGLHGEELPGRVTFDGFDEDGEPTTGELQMRGVKGSYFAVKQLDSIGVAPYWAEYKAWAEDTATDAPVLFRRAA